MPNPKDHFDASNATAVVFDPFAVSLYRFKGNSARGYAAKNLLPAVDTATNFDLKLLADRKLNGGKMLVLDAARGDWVEFWVVDKDGILYPPETYLDQFIERWEVFPGVEMDLNLNYGSVIAQGLWIRSIYHAKGILLDPYVMVNYGLHKPL